MLALDGYLDILLGYELLFAFLRKGKQSAITTYGDGLSRQTFRFDFRSFPGKACIPSCVLVLDGCI